MESPAHQAELVKSHGKVLRKFTSAVVRRGWVWGQKRKMRYEADAADLHNKHGRCLGEYAPPSLQFLEGVEKLLEVSTWWN